MTLDRHPDVVGVSEIVQLNRHKPGTAVGENTLASPFWAEVAKHYRAQTGARLENVKFMPENPLAPSDPPSKEWCESNLQALKSIAEVSGKRVVADASKEAPRLNALLQVPGLKVRIIYMVRDARAIAYAYNRKYRHWMIGFRRLAKIGRAAHDIHSVHPEAHFMTLRYEDFATNTEAELRRVCQFAALDFSPDMLTPDASTFNGVGGNRLRLNPAMTIELDEAWRIEMTTTTRALVTVAALPFNIANGYILSGRR